MGRRKISLKVAILKILFQRCSFYNNYITKNELRRIVNKEIGVSKHFYHCMKELEEMGLINVTQRPDRETNRETSVTLPEGIMGFILFLRDHDEQLSRLYRKSSFTSRTEKDKSGDKLIKFATLLTKAPKESIEILNDLVSINQRLESQLKKQKLS